MTDVTSKPLAAEGYDSYRYKGAYGWIMIGANSDAEALGEARRSIPDPKVVLSLEKLQRWDGSAYVVCQVPTQSADQEPNTTQPPAVDLKAVAEWVGLHYQKNFAAESKEQRADWIARYVEMHAADTGAVATPSKMVKFVVDVRATGEDGEKPDFAVIDVDQGFLDKVAKLAALCATNQLVSVSTRACTEWGGYAVENLRLQGSEMVTDSDGLFWFEAYPTFESYVAETHAVAVVNAAEKFASAADGEVLFLSDDDEAALREAYEESIGEQMPYESDAG